MNFQILDHFAPKAQATIFLKNPRTGEEMAASITLAMPEHPARRALEIALQQRIRAELASNGGKLPPVDEATALQREIDFLTACTLDWNLRDTDQEPIPPTPENIREFYASPRADWVRRQINVALMDANNFFDELPVNSPSAAA